MLSMLIFAAAAAGSSQMIEQPNPLTANPACHMKGFETVAAKPRQPVTAQKLNELPNADAYLTVLRTDEHGCNKPAIVAYDIGSAPRHQR